jgi:hypothetical protein
MGGNAHDQQRGRGRHQRAHHRQGPTLDLVRTELMAGAGPVKVGALYENETRRFATPLDRYRFPLAGGRDVEPVRQQFRRDDEDIRPDQHYVQRSRLGDGRDSRRHVRRARPARRDMARRRDFWRFPTQCNYTSGMRPRCANLVRMVKFAS